MPALKMISLHLGLVMDSADILEAWSKSRSPAAPIQMVE